MRISAWVFILLAPAALADQPEHFPDGNATRSNDLIRANLTQLKQGLLASVDDDVLSAARYTYSSSWHAAVPGDAAQDAQAQKDALAEATSLLTSSTQIPYDIKTQGIETASACAAYEDVQGNSVTMQNSMAYEQSGTNFEGEYEEVKGGIGLVGLSVPAFFGSVGTNSQSTWRSTQNSSVTYAYVPVTAVCVRADRFYRGVITIKPKISAMNDRMLLDFALQKMEADRDSLLGEAEKVIGFFKAVGAQGRIKGMDDTDFESTNALIPSSELMRLMAVFGAGDASYRELSRRSYLPDALVERYVRDLGGFVTSSLQELHRKAQEYRNLYPFDAADIARLNDDMGQIDGFIMMMEGYRSGAVLRDFTLAIRYDRIKIVPAYAIDDLYHEIMGLTPAESAAAQSSVQRLGSDFLDKVYHLELQ